MPFRDLGALLRAPRIARFCGAYKSGYEPPQAADSVCALAVGWRRAVGFGGMRNGRRLGPGRFRQWGGPVLFDTSVAHVARVYDYWLGGKDNFAADRAAGDQAIGAFPAIPLSARANRAYLARVVRFLTVEAGIRQFLDIGTGIPTANHTHQVAQSVAPDCRVVTPIMTR